MKTKRISAIMKLIRDASREELIVLVVLVLPLFVGSWLAMLQLIADRPSTISKAAVAGTVCIIATLGLVVAKRGQHHAVAAEKAQARQEDDDWSDAIALYQRLKKRKNRKASVSRIVNSANGLLNTQRIAELRKLFPMFFVAISIRAEDQTTIDGVELVNEQHFERVVTARVEYLFGSVDE